MKNLKNIIVVILSACLLAGCANDQYSIEKNYWKAKKSADSIFNNPHASPPFELERAVKLLDAFSKKYHENDLSVDAQFKIASLYLVKKQYDKGRARLGQIIDVYSDSELVSSEALFLVGKSYELEDKWGLALNHYKRIIKEYPLTKKGFDVPLYIAQYYKIKYQPDKMNAAYREAAVHYKTLAGKHEDSLIGFSAYNLVARCYMALKEWDKSIDSFNIIIDKYKGKVNLDSIYLNTALIYKNELKNKSGARGMIEKLIEEYPQSKLTNTATDLLKEIDKK
ncbi:MAG: tetratricopeptide repeat protein [Candidatus Omnitrophica bacterium]|nr:tetratricopeptide repeat protein [Candidatus Omnitrophota bacterium]